MCLAVCGKVVKIDGMKAVCDFGGTKREISIMLVEGVKVGDYVLVHAGFAISILNPQEAKETLKTFEMMYKVNE